MSESTPKPNRTPWIIVGVLGCLVICLIGVVAVLGLGLLGGYFATQPATPIVVLPTQPPLMFPTATLVPRPTLPGASPTLPPVVLPTVPPLTVLPGAGTPASTPTEPPLTVVTRSPVPAVSPSPVLAVTPTPTRLPTSPGLTSIPLSRVKLAFTVRRGDRPEDNYVWIMNGDGSGAKEILKRASEPTFSPDGRKIAYYHWTDGIFVANVDGTDQKKIVGESNSGYPAWSHDGKWIAFSVRPGRSGNITTDAVAPDGTGRRAIGIGWSPAWSPDDKLIAFQTCRGTQCGIFRVSSAGGEAVPISTDDGGLAAWSPDGRRILYQRDVDGVKQLFVMNADGSDRRQLTKGPALHVSGNWSPDGNFIFYRSPEGGQWGIWRMNADGSNPVKIANDMPPGDWPYDRIAVAK